MDKDKFTVTERPNAPTVLSMKQDSSLVQGLEELLEMARNEELEGFIFAGFLSNDQIVTAKCDVNVIEQQHLTSVLQIDTTLRIFTESVVETIDKPKK